MSTTNPDWIAYEKAHPIKVENISTAPHVVTLAASDQLRSGRNKDRWETLYAKGADTFHVRTHMESMDRMLRVIDALAKAFDARGFELRYQKGDEDFDGLAVCIADELIRFRLWEDAVGQIDLMMPRRMTCGGRSIWRDRLGRRIELQLNNIMLGLRKEAAARTHARLWSEATDRRVGEFHRKRAELKEQVEEERQDVNALFAEAVAWQQAQSIRAYIAAVEALPVPKGQRRKRANWIAWAREQADRKDPLTKSPPSVLDTPKKDYGELPPWEDLPEELFEWP